eukprot:CFRG4791T1
MNVDSMSESSNENVKKRQYSSSRNNTPTGISETIVSKSSNEPAELTEELILDKANRKQLDRVKFLNLAGLGLKALNSDLLSSEQLPKLTRIYLSDNNLTEVNFNSDKLLFLDVSNNDIQSLEALHLENFPSLKTLIVLGNQKLTSVIKKDAKKFNSNIESLNGYDLSEGSGSCVVCGLDYPDDKMIICDGCDDLYHFWCGDEVVESTPEDEWHCPYCSYTLNSKKRRTAESKSRGLTEVKSIDSFKYGLRIQSLLRIHSDPKSRNGAKDDSTEVWACAFHPQIDDQRIADNVVATCGGASLCITNVEQTKVLFKLTDANDSFTCLTWVKDAAKLDQGFTGSTGLHVLAVAGQSGNVRLVDPWTRVAFDLLAGNGDAILCLQAHPDKHNWLLAGGGRTIDLWEVGAPAVGKAPAIPTIKLCRIRLPQHVLTVCLPPFERISQTTTFLIVGGDQGYLAKWRIDDTEVGGKGKRTTVSGDSKSKPEKRFSSSEVYVYEVNSVHRDVPIDQVLYIKENIVASKSVHDGRIVLWDHVIGTDTRAVKKRDHIHGILNHSVSHKYFYKAAVTEDGCTLISGDMDGKLKIYDMASKLRPYLSVPPCQVIQYDNPGLKTPLRCVAISPSEKYVVGVTGSNMVAVWVRNVDVDSEKYQ